MDLGVGGASGVYGGFSLSRFVRSGGSGLIWTQGHQLGLCRVGLAWLVGRSFGKSGRFTRQQHQQQQDRIGLGFSFGHGNATLRLWFVYLR
jgi:hypothetical protein